MKLAVKRNKTFGLLTAIKRDWTRLDRVYWICKCSCGIIKSVRSDSLGKGTVSCGCYSRELNRKAHENAGSITFKNSKGRLFYYMVVKPLYNQIKHRDNNECVLCGAKIDLHIHHILRKSRYPQFIFEPNNLCVLCDNCHFFDAHKGNTNLIDLDLSAELLGIVFEHSKYIPIDETVIKNIQEKLNRFRDTANEKI